MAKGLIVVTYKEIKDEEKLAAYVDIAPATVEQYGGKFLCRGYPAAVKESGKNERTTVALFDSLEVALKWYQGPEYTRALNALGDGVVRDFKFYETVG